MEKKLYDELMLEVVNFTAEDVIATSGEDCRDDVPCEETPSYTCEGHEE